MITEELPGIDALPEAARSRLRQSIAERERLERALLMLPQALFGRGIDQAIAVFAEAACETTAARVGVVALPGLRDEPVVVGQDSGRVRAQQLVDDPMLQRALQGERVQVAATGAGARAGTTDGRPLRSVLALPIRSHEQEMFGMLVLAHHRASAFSSRQVALAEALAAQLAQAVEVTGAIAEHQRISAALQETLLPPLLPVIDGLDLAARYRPSGRGSLVGGDFYDVFSDGKGGWSILLGDASGVGPEAAGLAGIVRYTARALAETATSPLEVLAQLNRAVLRAAPEGRFCSAVLATYAVDASGTRVALASAGHPPTYLLSAEGRAAAAMEETGTILGMIDSPPFGYRELDLSPGDALVQYTDGVVEARDERGQFFGDDRLATVLAGAAGRSAEGIARRLELEVLDHRGVRAFDDLAVVVSRVPPRPR